MIKLLKAITLFLPAILIISCSAVAIEQPNSQSNHELESNTEFQEIWRRSDIFLGENNRRPNIVSGSGTVAILGIRNTDYIGGSIFGIGASDGEDLWELPGVGGEQIVTLNNILFRGTTGTAHLQAYNLETGEFLWQNRLGRARSVLDIYPLADKVFAFTINNELFELNNNGEIISNSKEDFRSFIVMEGITYMEDVLSIKAVNLASKNELWKININSRYTHAPIFDKGEIFLRTEVNPADIYSIDQLTGNVNWKKSYNALSNLYITNDKVYFLSSDSNLVVINRESGSEIIKVKFLPPFNLSKSSSGYFITGDNVNNILLVCLGDKGQIIGLKIKDP
ncbi:MAG: PQQ-binding-like beta-propeller repeat protein [Anaerolineales bacterium]|nr:MAG: PQQ-binding-like beta-propeller repeat protein [Anaerolineales bacterium]